MEKEEEEGEGGGGKNLERERERSKEIVTQRGTREDREGGEGVCIKH